MDCGGKLPSRFIDRLLGIEQGVEPGGAEEADLGHIKDDLRRAAIGDVSDEFGDEVCGTHIEVATQFNDGHRAAGQRQG
jgi:hypothetical protein